jgi:dihydrofolate reductase
MRKIFLFMMVSLDGYFEGPNHDLSWHNAKNEEFKRLEAEHKVESDAILMGHTTYDMMAGFWPTPMAQEMDAKTAKFMNETQKFVVSHEPFDPGWRNVSVIHGDVFGQIKALKEKSGKDIALLGSNNLCVSLMQKGLVDEFRIMVNPVVLGKGTKLFAGIKSKLDLKLVKTREFKSGNVLLYYRPN